MFLSHTNEHLKLPTSVHLHHDAPQFQNKLIITIRGSQISNYKLN